MTALVPQDQENQPVPQTLLDRLSWLWDQSQTEEQRQALTAVFEEFKSLLQISKHYLKTLQAQQAVIDELEFQRTYLHDELQAMHKRRDKRARSHLASDMALMLGGELTPTDALRFLEATLGEAPDELSPYTRLEIAGFVQRIAEEVFEMEVFSADENTFADIDFEEIED